MIKKWKKTERLEIKGAKIEFETDENRILCKQALAMCANCTNLMSHTYYLYTNKESLEENGKY